MVLVKPYSRSCIFQLGCCDGSVLLEVIGPMVTDSRRCPTRIAFHCGKTIGSAVSGSENGATINGNGGCGGGCRPSLRQVASDRLCISSACRSRAESGASTAI